MLTKITMALVALAMLATAVVSPALAQSAPSGVQQGARNSGGFYHGYPLSEWYRTDSW